MPNESAVFALCNQIIDLCATLKEEMKECKHKAETNGLKDAARFYESAAKDIGRISNVAEALKMDIQAGKIGASAQLLMCYTCEQAEQDLRRIPEKRSLQIEINSKLSQLLTLLPFSV